VARWRWTAFLLISGVALAGHFWLLTRKIHPISGSEYGSHAVDLRETPRWRYGFFAGHHGAVLVKTLNLGKVPTAKESGLIRELKPVMERELRLIPRKAVLEAVLYLLVLGYLILVTERLRIRLLNPGRNRLARLALELVPGAIFFALAAGPLLLWGYGYGGFSNLAGPGALSYSGPYFSLTNWLMNSGNTISYRAFISPILLPVDVLSELLQLAAKRIPIYGDVMENGLSPLAYCLLGVGFYGVVGLVAGRVGHRTTTKPATDVTASVSPDFDSLQ